MNSFLPKPERQGFRGYIASRRVRGDRIQQSVQNLVVRDYAQRMKVGLRLPVVEYAMPGCYMMLESVMDELPQIEGVIFFSLFMLPERASRREAIYQRIFDAGASLHGALESMAIWQPSDVGRIEDIFRISRIAHAGQADIKAMLEHVT
jgi:sporadic carbohydrate cluster protein (TIGR04323 family)